MSETTGAPAAPATPAPAAPAQAPTPGVVPSQGISVRQAAQMLAAQRRMQAEGGAEAAPQAPAAETAPPAPGAAPADPAPARDVLAEARAELLGQKPPPDDSGASPYEIDGRSYTPAELRAAISQSADYTKKTQDIARQTRELQAQQQQFAQLRTQHEAFAQVLPLLQGEINQLIQTFQPAAEPDVGLIDSNPQEYQRQWAAFEHNRREMARLQQLLGHQQAAQERNLNAAVQKSNEILSEKYAFWRDPAARAKVQNEVAEWATTRGGYTREELRNLADHRHFEALYKAYTLDSMMDGAKTTAPPQIRPPVGAAPPPPAPAAIRAAETAFGQRPSWRTGAALISARRAQNGRY